MAVVESPAVRLHEQNHGVQEQEHLRSPCPVENERHGNPEHQPDDLVYALDGHAAVLPCECAVGGGSAPHTVEGQRHQGGGHHEEIGDGQMPDLDGEQGPDLDAHGVSRILDVAQHGGDGHDGKSDPK